MYSIKDTPIGENAETIILFRNEGTGLELRMVLGFDPKKKDVGYANGAIMYLRQARCLGVNGCTRFNGGRINSRL